MVTFKQLLSRKRPVLVFTTALATSLLVNASRAEEKPTDTQGRSSTTHSGPVDPASPYHEAMMRQWYESGAPYYDFRIQSKNFIGNDLEPNIDASNIGITVGNAEFDTITQAAIDSWPSDSKLIYGASVKASLVPTFLAKSTEKKLDKKAAEKIVEGVGAYRPYISGQVRAALAASNPSFNSVPFNRLPDPVQNAIVAHGTDGLISATIRSKEQVVDAILHQRVQDLRIETTFQEAVVSVGKVLGDGQAMVYLSVGKMRVNGGAEVDINANTTVGAVRPTNSNVEAMATAANTGAIRAGVVKVLDNDVRVGTEVYFFHDQMPFINGSHYVGSVASLDQAAYNHHKDWYKLDSAMLRLFLSSENIDISLSVASYDGKGALAGSVTYKINPSNNMILTGYVGDRDTMKAGVALYYIHSVTENLAIYCGAEWASQFKDPLVSDRAFDQYEFVAGLRWKLPERRWIPADATVFLEAFDRVYGGGLNGNSFGVQGGFSSSLSFKRKIKRGE